MKNSILTKPKLLGVKRSGLGYTSQERLILPGNSGTNDYLGPAQFIPLELLTFSWMTLSIDISYCDFRTVDEVERKFFME